MTTTTTRPKSRSGSPTSRGSGPATPSFFVIQEPTATRSPVASHGTNEGSPVVAARGDLDKQRHALASRQSLQQTHSLNSSSSGPRRSRKRREDSPSVLHEETEQDLLVDDDDERRQDEAAATKPRVLSILNRCGSSPELPLHNSWSSAVFTSSKKRQLLKPTTGNGASPHFTAMQRSRLIPLPINIRTGTLKRTDTEAGGSPMLVGRSGSLGSLRDSKHPIDNGNTDAEEEKMNYDISIASLKQRLSIMEKEAVKALKQRQALERQIDAMTKEQHALHGERVQLTKKLSDLETTNMHQRNAFEKLSEKYSTVYSSLAKVNDVGGGTGDQPNRIASLQVVIQTVARENQELQRKVRVLETRHAEDKVIVGNQEKQLKRLRAEMEALQHMAGSKEEAAGISTTKSQQNADAITNKTTPASRSESSSAIIAAPRTTPAPETPSQSQSEEAAYIDPNILKVLEKVDSQFSITNAIALSAVLKRWLHSCLHIVASVDLHGVLLVLMKRVCELLHCNHAAVFHVDHSAKKLVGISSERGHVRWEMPLDKGILGHAARHNVICNVRKAYDDPRFFSSSDTITGTKSREVLCIPLTRELDAFQSDPSTNVSSSSVFAVLQCWNTSTQKPFTQNDQILGGLLGIHAGIVLSQTKLSDSLQRVHNRVLQITHMSSELAPKAIVHPSSQVEGDLSAVSIVHLVRAAQRKFAEIVGITKMRIFVLDSDVMRVWHVGAAKLEAGASSSTDIQAIPVRKYASVYSTICGLLLSDSTADTQTEALATSASSCRILIDPTGEPTFNDTVDLKGGANGLYIAAIRSPWREMPLGMIQVARSAPLGNASLDPRPMSTATKKERLRAQDVEDELTMGLIDLFCQQFSSLLHHAIALQLHENCPSEIQKARLSYLTDRLDLLESEYLREQEEAEAEVEAMAKHAMANTRLEQKLLESLAQGQQRTSESPLPGCKSRRKEDDVVFEPVPLISTDSSYAIDISEANVSPAESGSDTNSSRMGDEVDSGVSSLSPSEMLPF